MFHLRPFRNSDPPAIVEVWRQQGPERGCRDAISVPVLEHFVYGKPYFDRQGLIVAEHEGRVVGFVHAGFGPSEDYSDVAKDVGVTCMLQMLPEFEATDLGATLLAASEEYLRQHSVCALIGGAYPPFTPFYHGLVQSSELPGVFASDSLLHTVYRDAGYEVADEFAILDCELGRIRPVVDRNQRLLAKSFQVRPTIDHAFDTWWDTCTFGPVQRSQFELIDKSDKSPCGSMIWWDLDAIRDTARPSIAISRLRVASERRREGLATFLIMSALKQLKSSGALKAQVQVPTSNQPALDFFRRIGFAETGRGTSYRKPLDSV